MSLESYVMNLEAQLLSGYTSCFNITGTTSRIRAVVKMLIKIAFLK